MRRWLVASILLASVPVAPAAQFIVTDGYTLNSGRTLTNELWIVADHVTVKGTIKDDFFAACVGGPTLLGDARLAGAFQNDVRAAGGAIDFTGIASEHARFLAYRVTMDGRVKNSAIALGNTVTLTTNSIIDGDAALAGQSVVVDGRIRGNLRVFSVSATLSGTIDGNVRIAAVDIVVMPGTVIKGNLVYTSNNDLFLDPEKVVLEGQLVRKEVETFRSNPLPSTLIDVVVSQAFLYLCALVAGIPFIALFPQFTGRAVRAVRLSPWKCSLAGFVAFCMIPMTSLFVLLTVIGIPLGLLLVLAYAIMLYLGKIVVALGIGGIALSRRGPQPFSHVFSVLSIGLIAIYMVTALPMIGSFVAFAILLTGLGGMMFAIFPSQIAPEPPAPTPPPVSGLPPSSLESRNSAGQEEPSKKE